MKVLYCLTVLTVFTLVSSTAYCNNIQVENVSLEDQVAADHYVFIEFDISWDNSWRTATVPNNWDAAWIFCKYRIAGGTWQHSTLHSGGHIAPAGSTIDAASDSTGIFIYRESDGNGTNNWDNVRLRWDYGSNGVNDDASLEVKVFAIEMVYVTEGSFYLGDSTSADRFFQGNNNKSFYQVTSENEITVLGSGTNLWAMGVIGAGTIPAEYPKGYQAFYVMKYEVSQEQYIEFLNTLTRIQQNAVTASTLSDTNIAKVYVLSNQSFVSYRNGVRCDALQPDTVSPIYMYANGNGDANGNDSLDCQNVVCSYVGWRETAAYLDWSALRPMTELEFEKACRGPNYPVGGEFAWGNSLINEVPFIPYNVGKDDEYFYDLPVNTGNCLYALSRPTSLYHVKCGVFAASSVNHTRMETGATYYGIMEMSGSTRELLVSAYGLAGRSYTGLHGDGNLLPSGYADTDYWPGINGNNSTIIANTVYLTSGVTGYGGSGARGGHINSETEALCVSFRSYASGLNLLTRSPYQGFRGCRTAP